MSENGASKEKTARRKVLCLLFEKTVSMAQGCLGNNDTLRVMFVPLKNSLFDCRKNLNNIDEEIFDLVEPKNVENQALECIRVLQPFHDVMGEISLQLGKLDVTLIPVRPPPTIVDYQN